MATQSGLTPGTPSALPAAAPARKRPTLTRRQKAAIIVRLLLKEGARLKLDELPEAMQVELTHEMGALRTVDRATMNQVVSEFIAEVNDLGASFPGGLEGALSLLDGALSEPNLRRLRKQTGLIVQGDPWEMIARLAPADIAAIVQRESTEIAAVILSKLPVARSAEILGHLPGDVARRITYAVSTTSSVDPDTVRTIGQAIAAQVADESPRAFVEPPVSRIGAILNSSSADIRDGVLNGLIEEDAELGAEVKKKIFTFADIPVRVDPRDIPKITRAVDQGVLVTALAVATEGEIGEAGEFVLANMSQRMAGQLREDIADRGKVKPRDAEDAMSTIIAAIRDMEAAGELTLTMPEE
ncbi:MAG: flagellar motor switch protein FliG [Rhodobacteraceae bacterium]|nr:flagellar motor switch protein FliG [Paracoccaceae bacterium]